MNGTRVKTAIIGIGKWGRNVACELNAASELVAYASTGSPESITWATEHIPSTSRLSLEEIYTDSSIEAVAIATPVHTHAAIAETLLHAGKHVLIEKPLAESSEEASRLMKLATERHLTLMTGYVYLYAPAYRKLKKLLLDQRVTDVVFSWNKWGTFAEDIEQNLLTHHLALSLDLFGTPESGNVIRGPGIESACDLITTTLEYPSFSVRSTIDRASTDEKTHTLTVTCDDGTTYVWDGTHVFETKGTETVSIFEDDTPPLSIEIETFLARVRNETTNEDVGAVVVKLHERLTRQ